METVKALVNTNGPQTGYQVNEDAIIAAVKQEPWIAHIILHKSWNYTN